jgi:hypothetical protein
MQYALIKCQIVFSKGWAETNTKIETRSFNTRDWQCQDHEQDQDWKCQDREQDQNWNA